MDEKRGEGRGWGGGGMTLFHIWKGYDFSDWAAAAGENCEELEVWCPWPRILAPFDDEVAGTPDVDEKDRFGSNYLAQTAYPIAFLWRINHQVSVLTRFAEIAHLKLIVEEGFGSKLRWRIILCKISILKSWLERLIK